MLYLNHNNNKNAKSIRVIIKTIISKSRYLVKVGNRPIVAHRNQLKKFEKYIILTFTEKYTNIEAHSQDEGFSMPKIQMQNI